MAKKCEVKLSTLTVQSIFPKIFTRGKIVTWQWRNPKDTVLTKWLMLISPVIGIYWPDVPLDMMYWEEYLIPVVFSSKMHNLILMRKD